MANIARSTLFYTNRYVDVEEKLKMFLDQQPDYLSERTAQSPRAAGDAIQELLAANFQQILGEDICSKYSTNFARRAMADLAFEDKDEFYYIVDVKTHRLSTKFNMPNLTSVERLARFYEDDKNYFVILLISYDVLGLQVVVQHVRLLPIEFLGMGMSNDWGFRVGPNSNCKFKCHSYKCSILSQTMDDRAV